MRSEEGEDGGEGLYIVRRGLTFLRGEVDVAAVVGDENVLVTATRFHGQLTGEVRRRGIVAGNSTDERGQSKEVRSRESQREGVEERREASARKGWRDGVLEERRFFLTTSR